MSINQVETTIKLKAIEMVLLFVVLPIILSTALPLYIKLGFIVLGLSYVILIILRTNLLRIKLSIKLDWKGFLKTTSLKFVIVALVTTGFVWYNQPNVLFCVPLHKPLLFVMILFVFYTWTLGGVVYI